MGPAVRTVCVACLHSLEISGAGDFGEEAVCPHCGYQVDLCHPWSDTSTGDGFALPPPEPDAVTPKVDAKGTRTPARIGRFVLREPLGEGGYGQVFRAYDPHLERDVALKVLKLSRLGEKALERFFREARAAARLDHPNIVGLHDAGRDEGRCWIAYQLVPGQTLSMVRDLERPSMDASVRIVLDLAMALDHAHGRGVFHRDIKPANIMIDDSGRARLTDFGLARRTDLDSDLTVEGTVLGTPQYMSPEAAAGRAHEADGRSDVYSLGVILYELICGKRPSDLPTNAGLWHSAKVVSPSTPRSVVRTIPVDLDRICMKALAFDPEARYPDARSFAQAMSGYLQKKSQAHPSFKTTPKDGRLIGLVVVASVLCLLFGMSLQVSPRPRKSTAPVDPGPRFSSPILQSRPQSRTAEAEPRKINAAISSPQIPVVVKSLGSNKFHLPWCKNARSISPRNRQEFPFPDEATLKNQDLKPCDICKPTLEKLLDRIAKGP